MNANLLHDLQQQLNDFSLSFHDELHAKGEIMDTETSSEKTRLQESSILPQELDNGNLQAEEKQAKTNHNASLNQSSHIATESAIQYWKDRALAAEKKLSDREREIQHLQQVQQKLVSKSSQMLHAYEQFVAERRMKDSQANASASILRSSRNYSSRKKRSSSSSKVRFGEDELEQSLRHSPLPAASLFSPDHHREANHSMSPVTRTRKQQSSHNSALDNKENRSEDGSFKNSRRLSVGKRLEPKLLSTSSPVSHYRSPAPAVRSSLPTTTKRVKKLKFVALTNS